MASLARSAVLCFPGKHCQCTAYTSINKDILCCRTLVRAAHVLGSQLPTDRKLPVNRMGLIPLGRGWQWHARVQDGRPRGHCCCMRPLTG